MNYLKRSKRFDDLTDQNFLEQQSRFNDKEEILEFLNKHPEVTTKPKKIVENREELMTASVGNKIRGLENLKWEKESEL